MVHFKFWTPEIMFNNIAYTLLIVMEHVTNMSFPNMKYWDESVNVKKIDFLDRRS